MESQPNTETDDNGNPTQKAGAAVAVTRSCNRCGDCGVVDCVGDGDDDDGRKQRIILSNPPRA